MRNAGLSDIELLDLIKQHDASAFRVLFERYWEQLYLFALKRLKSKQDAEDAVQHVFMSIWDKRSVRNIHFSLQHYLYKSVSYECIAALKRMLDRPSDIEAVDENILPLFSDVLENMSLQELNQLIETEISRLPHRMQQIYRLSREQDLSVREIAVSLNVSEQTVKNQLTTALHRLRKPVTDAMLLLLANELMIR
ncbi:sigma-70 family RNA polymerase sigma factor [Pseudoflavitalea sp. G-6-1-2]|uniref:RNA polymerase sigma factor n=1 Tax=Pseudoflavitalea sp. G-6-1-2 TaxID=2728841 RepID=UPI00146BE44F|nr:sigma-70 family RNA polymerase sigma factor [Pseudoflavitalea sp. G-6-1-2]NML23586.1 sigma-70 family RNA polymerase sigma factor [Pseudoflavitalea sp. G-6-1-2]